MAEALRHTKRGGGQLGTSPADLPFPSLPVVDGDGQPGSRDGLRWLMASDVCKHCTHAGCLDVCPTGALFRTEFGTVVVQQDICNGCGYCVSACPYGVIDRRPDDGRAAKCTLCYDRLHGGLEPACAKACPTQSIQFGPLDELRERAGERLADLHADGVPEARLYGEDPDNGVGGDGAFFLLLDEPEAYGLPPDPVVPTRNLAAMLEDHRAWPPPRCWAAAAARSFVRPGAGAAGAAVKAREELAVPKAEFRSYYGRPVLKPPVWEWKIPAYLFTGGLAAGSALLAAGADLTGRPALRRAGRLGGFGALLASLGLLVGRPGPAGTLPPHAAGGQADLADERRHLDPHRVRARQRARGRRRTAPAALPRDRGPAGCWRWPPARPGCPPPPSPPAWPPTPRRCCPRPRSRPGTRPATSCRSCSPGRPRPAAAAWACWPPRSPRPPRPAGWPRSARPASWPRRS